MNNIEYVSLQDLDKKELLEILNKEKVREHLVSHDDFDQAALEEWVSGKVKVDSSKGCKVKGIKVNDSVAGWCGIQFENNAYELAIVLDEEYWGIGIRVFKEVLSWASELGHSHIVLHLLNTRPVYKSLSKMASRVYENTMFGQKYTSYEIKVPCA
jgi:GNAT superfamily N-acetyltransferase